MKKFVQSIDLFTVSDSQKVFCDDITATISGQNGNLINVTATFSTHLNDLKALFCISIPGDESSNQAPDLTNYKCVGACVIQDNSAVYEISCDEWSSMSITAYVIVPTNQFIQSDKVELA